MPADTLLQAIDGLKSELSARSTEIEDARRLPADIAGKLAVAGLFNMLKPAALGGLQVSPQDMSRALMHIAAANASAGWCVMIGTTSTLAGAYLDRAAADAVYGEPLDIHGGVFAPMGRAEDMGSHYLLNGTWQWGSGSANCAWLSGGAMIFKDGELQRSDSGAPRHRMMFFPADQAECIDTWHVAGLGGTGSGDFKVTNVRIPKDRSVSFIDDSPRDPAPLYKFPLFGLLSLGVASVTLGNARGALDESVALLKAKRTAGGARSQSQRATVQADIAWATAALHGAQAWLEKTVDEAWREALSDAPISVAARGRLRLACATMSEVAADVCKTAYTLGGGSSVYLASSLQRRFRDAHVMTQHLAVSSATFELAGRVLLDEPVDTAML
ncbi:acyl-CoA dehydrogenase family protein [Pontixanthobacter sp.]|uniref:acyl-CoA dehydrogenase family protein n=1 Tax=Pontixanthobacter sp. TaxID=2792078 RepID=UPI003C7E1D0E